MQRKTKAVKGSGKTVWNSGMQRDEDEVTGRPAKLSIEIVETATGEVEKKLGPYASVRLRDKADDGVNHRLDHKRFYTRFAD